MAQRAEKPRFPQKTAKRYLLEETELADNGSRRAPIIVCVDCSFSMRQGSRIRKGSRLEWVMEGLEEFCRDMNRDLLARDSVELCLISFGGSHACVECDFATPDHIVLPKLEADGETPLADAVSLALENLERRKQRYDENGISYYRPWLLIIGDGDESRPSKQLDEMAQILKEESDRKSLNVMCIMVGDETTARRESGSLLRLSPDGEVRYLKDLKFREFFAWLSRSIQKTSQSMSGEEIYYEPTGDWAEILTRGG